MLEATLAAPGEGSLRPACPHLCPPAGSPLSNSPQAVWTLDDLVGCLRLPSPHCCGVESPYRVRHQSWGHQPGRVCPLPMQKRVSSGGLGFSSPAHSHEGPDLRTGSGPAPGRRALSPRIFCLRRVFFVCLRPWAPCYQSDQTVDANHEICGEHLFCLEGFSLIS